MLCRPMRFAASALLVSLAISCSTKVSHMEVDPSLTPERIAGDGLAILGVTSILGDNSDAFIISRFLTRSLHDALRDDRPDIRVVPWGDVRLAIGDSLLWTCLDDVYEYERLRPASLDSLALTVGVDTKYSLMHRIEADQLEFTESEDKELVDDEWVVTGIKLKSTRRVSATFTIYDLETKEQVWLATIEGKKDTERIIPPEEKVDVDGWLGTVIDVVEVLDDILDDSPPAPPSFPKPATREEVMERIYGKFVDELPKEKG